MIHILITIYIINIKKGHKVFGWSGKSGRRSEAVHLKPGRQHIEGVQQCRVTFLVTRQLWQQAEHFGGHLHHPGCTSQAGNQTIAAVRLQPFSLDWELHMVFNPTALDWELHMILNCR
jgi:hypothetical protein